MPLKDISNKLFEAIRVGSVAFLTLQLSFGEPLVASAQAREKGGTRTPIKHVIFLIGENRTFDHVFATYI